MQLAFSVNSSSPVHSSMWAIGFINLLLWPWSVVWSVPEAAIDADIINKKKSIYFYIYGPGKNSYEPGKK